MANKFDSKALVDKLEDYSELVSESCRVYRDINEILTVFFVIRFIEILKHIYQRSQDYVWCLHLSKMDFECISNGTNKDPIWIYRGVVVCS